MDDRQAMLEAIALAAPAMPHPNPRVGAVVLDPAGAVVGRGSHRRAGESHAETQALAEARERARGGTVVVTLEPCHHYGRTPPCTEALIASGVARVVVGMVDPDERVHGAGVAALRAAGIHVETGVAAAEAEALDPGYFHHRRTGRPLVTLKIAATLDGQVAGEDGTSRWITGTEARRDAHELRARSDAVMVGAGTVLADDPSLDVRLEGFRGPQPQPVVVAGTRPLPASARVMNRNPIVFSPDGAAGSVALPGRGGVDLEAALRHLGAGGVVDLMVEGGPTLAAALLQEGLVDRLVLYLGARLGGGIGRPAFHGVFETLAEAVPVRIDDVRSVGPDLRVACTIEREWAAAPDPEEVG